MLSWCLVRQMVLVSDLALNVNGVYLTSNIEDRKTHTYTHTKEKQGKNKDELNKHVSVT